MRAFPPHNSPLKIVKFGDLRSPSPSMKFYFYPLPNPPQRGGSKRFYFGDLRSPNPSLGAKPLDPPAVKFLYEGVPPS